MSAMSGSNIGLSSVKRGDRRRFERDAVETT